MQGMSLRRALVRSLSSGRVRASVAVAGSVIAVGAAAAVPAISQADPSYTPQTPSLATVSSSSANPAPWNEWQGDSAGGTTPGNAFTITGNGASLVNPAQVLPTYEPASGSSAFPNVAVDQGASAADSDSTVPYQSGVVGSPGPLAGYCGSGDFNAETGLTSESGGGIGTMPTPSTQPNGETLPLGPDYFPHIVLNSDGTLTGYFDYRPKDENEAVLAATSTDGGKSWSFDQQALQQDADYCASGDTNDDGQGHPNVLNFGGTTTAGDVTSGGTNDLFTLDRAAGDNLGTGMLVHNLSQAGASASQPLGSLPSSQRTGVDPDTFDEDASAVTVPTSTSGNTVNLTVQNTGTPGTVNNLVAGGFVDLGAAGTANASDASAGDVIDCTGVTPSSDPADNALGTPNSPEPETFGQLTGCSVDGSSSITVNPQDMIEQVVGYISNQTPTNSYATAGDPQSTSSAGSTAATFPITLPNGPNSEADDGGYAQLDVSPNSGDATAASASSTDLGFTYELTGQTLNVNAPDRYYIDGTSVYCVQSNNNPTTEIENCTVPVGTSSPSVQAGDPILADPITPANTEMSTGLQSPDGIVGELHSFPADANSSFTVPNNATYVMYDEKEVNYYVAGELDKDKKGIAELKGGFTGDTLADPITFNPWEYISQDFGSQLTVTPSTGSGNSDAGQEEGTFALSGSTINFTMGDSTSGDYDQISCTGVETVNTPETTSGTTTSPVNANAGSLQSGADDAFTGCTITGTTSVTGATGGSSHSFGTNTMIAAPGAALAQPNQLQQQGEGKASSKASNAAKLYSNNEDLSILRAAWTTDGVNFYSDGLQNNGIISGSDSGSVASSTGASGSCASDTSYTDLSNPNTSCNPENNDGNVNLNLYAAAGSSLATEERWPGSGGSIIYNPATGEDELFLSGAWAGDGDSDAFNQVYYATSTNGLDWSVPKTVVSTDYSFSASEEQDAALTAGNDQPVGISAYYSGRAYGPAVVPNPNGGGFWMVFAGYNVPKGAGTAGDVLNDTSLAGTDPYLGAGQSSAASWTIGSGPNGDDPAMYRNILVDDLDADSGPALVFTAPTGAVYGGSATLDASDNSSEPVSYSVDASSGAGVCSVSGDTVTYTAAGTCVLDANQPAGDGYTDAATQQQVSVTVAQAPLTVTASSATVTYGNAAPTITASLSGLVNGDTPADLTPTCSTTYKRGDKVGTYTTSCSVTAPNYKVTSVDGKLKVVQASTVTSLSAASKEIKSGKSDKLTVKVTYASGQASGTVKIDGGSKLIATATLKDGKATIMVNKLHNGSNALTASYVGDSNLRSSKSRTVTVTVTQKKKR